jgi:predicted alpha/beta superfamily hydrolase
MKTPALGILLLLLPALPAAAFAAEPTANIARGLDAQSVGAPFVVPGAKQFDFISKLNNRPYRLMVWAPKDAATKAYPVIYFLDGNEYFAAAATDDWHYENSIMVGVGYITDSVAEWRERRAFELTPSSDPTSKVPSGGGEMFTRVLLEEMKPFIASRYKVQPDHQAIFGVSSGGLAVLNILFNHTSAFDTYIAGSPAISWDNRFVLKSEEAFSKRVKAGEVQVRVLITSSGNEQYRGTDPALLAAAQKSRMIDNASELAARLRDLNPKNMPVVYTLFPDETHGSGSYSSLRRGIAFALATQPQK